MPAGRVLGCVRVPDRPAGRAAPDAGCHRAVDPADAAVDAEQTTKFCACVGMRLASDICSTDYCEDKLKEVMHIVQCPNGAAPPPPA